jgi:hypothetical protein
MQSLREGNLAEALLREREDRIRERSAHGRYGWLADTAGASLEATMSV